MTVEEAILRAERIQPGRPVEGNARDSRWQAIIEIGEFVESHPLQVWEFVARWGRHEDSDLRAAVATCLLEHLLEHHFEEFIPRVEELAAADARFADTVSQCWEFGQAQDPENKSPLDRLRSKLRSSRGQR